jgi:demethoxyubiquinone hydroxylase (CLK1/Coq7/Cat5 family)
MPTITTTQKATLDSLLRGEMSAIETYRMAIEKLAGSNDPVAAQLQGIQRDHRDAADALWHYLERKGERPSEGSGAWGAFAKAVEGTATLLGNKAALKALKEGEEHGLKEHEEALDDDAISPELGSLLRTFVIRQQAHVQTLDRLLAAAK